MATVSQSAIASALNIPIVAVWSLSPAPVSGSNLAVLWDATQVAAFEAKWAASLANKWLADQYRGFAAFQLHARRGGTGKYYQPALADPLWDIAPATGLKASFQANANFCHSHRQEPRIRHPLLAEPLSGRDGRSFRRRRRPQEKKKELDFGVPV
jgi:hypothetical protein